MAGWLASAYRDEKLGCHVSCRILSILMDAGIERIHPSMIQSRLRAGDNYQVPPPFIQRGYMVLWRGSWIGTQIALE